MHIRPLEPRDIPAVAALFRILALEFIVHDAAQETAAMFLAANDAKAIGGYVESGFVYHVAIVDDALAGFIGVRERKHLYHMFVARQAQGRGIARAMWDVARRCAIDAGGDGVFTVNASDHAVGVYQAMGFARSAPRQSVKGLDVNPMRLAPSGPGFVGAA